MSKTVALTGKDTIKINGRILADFADGDVASLTFPNDLMVAKTGKNGNSIFSFKYDGQQAELSLRVLRTSSDDRFLNNLLALMKNDPPAFALMTGEFGKNIGDGAGNPTQDIYVLSGGVFKRNADVKENAEGETDQAVVVYTILFTNAPRAIGG